MYDAIIRVDWSGGYESEDIGSARTPTGFF